MKRGVMRESRRGQKKKTKTVRLRKAWKGGGQGGERRLKGEKSGAREGGGMRQLVSTQEAS